MHQVKDTIAVIAARNVAEHFNYEACGNHKRFWKFVGLDFDTIYPTNIIYMNDAKKRHWFLEEKYAARVMMLAGPYWKTAIKIIEKLDNPDTVAT